MALRDLLPGGRGRTATSTTDDDVVLSVSHDELAGDFVDEIRFVLSADDEVTAAPAALQSLIGRSLDQIIGPHDRPVVEAALDLARSAGQARVGDDVVLHLDGRAPLCDISLRSAGENRLLVAARDVGDRRRQEADAALLAARLEGLVDDGPDVTATLDDDLRVLWVSANCATLLGDDADALVGTAFDDLVHPDDRGFAAARLHAAAAGRAARDPARVRLADRSDARRVELLAHALDTEPPTGSVAVVIRDVTARTSLEDARDRLIQIVEATSDLIVIGDRDGRLTYANAAAADVFLGPDIGAVDADDGPMASLERADVSITDRFPAWARDLWRREVMPTLEADGLWRGDLAVVTPSEDGVEDIPVSLVAVGHRDEAGRLEYVSAITRDLRERQAFEARLRHQSTHDAITGLPNRALLVDRLEVALARAGRTGSGVALLFCDLDHFKVVNDSLGHEVGDDILRESARRLEATLRPGDTVARFGSDEFVLLCTDLDGEDDAAAVAEEVRRAFARPLAAGDSEVSATVSCGIAYAPGGRGPGDPVIPPESLIRDAGAAMHRAKERGRDRFELFDHDVRRQALERLDTEQALRRALEAGELRVQYQPEISVRSGAIVGFEALVRWQHPERGLIGPAEFVAVAEHTGLIVPLGRWVISEACRQLGHWHASIAPDAFMAVNVSARQLADPEIIDVLGEALEEAAVEPHRLEVEVTESVLMDDVERSTECLTALKELGVGLVVDDFGTGYSSLSYLRRFPVDKVKVDRSFVAGLGANDEDAAIVNAVVNLAHNLGLEAVAEGVESPVQLDALRELGCEYAQGFHLGRPVPPASIVGTETHPEAAAS